MLEHQSGRAGVLVQRGDVVSTLETEAGDDTPVWADMSGDAFKHLRFGSCCHEKQHVPGKDSRVEGCRVI